MFGDRSQKQIRPHRGGGGGDSSSDIEQIERPDVSETIKSIDSTLEKEKKEERKKRREERRNKQDLPCCGLYW